MLGAIADACLLARGCYRLQTDPHGLTSAEAQKRLAEYGPNKLPESSRIALFVFLGYMWNPLSWAMEAAAILAIILLDYADFALIVGLLLINSCISYVEESNADKAIKVGCCVGKMTEMLLYCGACMLLRLHWSRACARKPVRAGVSSGCSEQ